jgi:hypothetical protein
MIYRVLSKKEEFERANKAIKAPGKALLGKFLPI